MAQATVKCDKCGTTMYIDSKKARAICPECNHEQPLMSQDMLGNAYKVESFGDPTELLAKAEAYFDLQDYDRAAEFFAKAINVDPNEYKGWWGITRCRMVNNYLGIDNGYVTAFEKVKSLAPQEVIDELQIKYDVYLEALEKRKDKSKKLESCDPINREITIKASKGPAKNYTVDLIVGFVLAFLMVVSIVLMFFTNEKLRVFFIILAIMLALGSAYMFRHISESKKIIKLVTSGEVKTVSGLMEKMKRKDKLEFLKLLGSMIVAKYFVDYKIVDAEYILKAESESDYEEEKIKVDKKEKKPKRKDKKEAKSTDN